jgi:hypothetical protein
MRRFLIALMLVSGLGGASAWAQDATSDIRAVISDQIAAFQADDFETAFGFASPMIRQMFGSPSRFGAMVRSGYPMVWRPVDLRFSALAERDGRKVQSVVVTDRAGALHVLDYEMIEGDDGWRINGVRLRSPTGAGA